MRRLSMLCVAAGLAATALAVSSPANASPYKVVRWEGTGFCEIWDSGFPITPVASDYRTVTKPMPTFLDALAAKDHLWRAGKCTF